MISLTEIVYYFFSPIFDLFNQITLLLWLSVFIPVRWTYSLFLWVNSLFLTSLYDFICIVFCIVYIFSLRLCPLWGQGHSLIFYDSGNLEGRFSAKVGLKIFCGHHNGSPHDLQRLYNRKHLRTAYLMTENILDLKRSTIINHFFLNLLTWVDWNCV